MRETPISIIQEIRHKQILKPQDLVEVIRHIEEREPAINNAKEHFWAIGLNSRNNILYVDLVSMGTLNYNLVHPRESFRKAIWADAAAVIFIHNHPSETPEFSDEDISLMKRLKQAGQLLGIEMLEFLVYAGGDFVSAKKQDLI